VAARKGIVTFGLVSIPVELHVAARSTSLDFDLLHEKDQSRIKYKHEKDQSRIKYKLWCVDEDREVARKEVVKGYKADGGYVVMEDEDFEKAERATSRAVDVVQFVDEAEVDPVYLERSYWVAPQADAERAYQVLLAAMREAKKAAVVTFVMSNRQQYALLRADGDRLALHTLYYGDEVRDFVPDRRPAKPDKREVAFAAQYIEALTKPFEPGRYRDEYREKLLAIIHAKADGREAKLPEAPRPPGKVVSLVEALRASVEHVRKPLAKAEAGRRARPASSPRRRPAARRARAKKAA
jgi:DNA end-binding protein Ku